MHKHILITGITGFLGSNLAENFLYNGYSVIGLKRTKSDTSRCKHYANKVIWINADQTDWQKQVIKLKPFAIVHAAWNGVTNDSRNNLKEQLSNLDLITDLLVVAKDAGCKKFIGLGSQAEYGKLSQIAKEDQKLKPVNYYGIAKILSSELVARFCLLNEINWYWLRIFSIFGKNESEHWLIPSLVKKIVQGEIVLNFSIATQKYAYLHVSDFAKMVYLIIDKSPSPPSGIYNISANNALPLKEVIEKIRILCRNEQVVLKFGSIPLRENQSIHIEGEMTKFFTKISEIDFCNFETALENTIDFYLNFFKKEIYNTQE